MHVHAVTPEKMTRVLKAAIVVTVVFVAMEFAGGACVLVHPDRELMRSPADEWLELAWPVRKGAKEVFLD